MLTNGWVEGVVDLLSHSASLNLFQLYATETIEKSPLINSIALRMVEHHGRSLSRFSVHRVKLGLFEIEKICTECPNLWQLFMLVDPGDLVSQSIGAFRYCDTNSGSFFT